MSRRRRFAWLSVVVLVATGLLVALCPQPSLYGNTGFSTAVLDRNGELLRLTLAADERYRLRVSLGDVAPAAVEAILLYEDRRFFSHPGFNIGSLLRAAWSTYISGDRPVGGSTISMQLARLRFGLNTRSVGGKLRQIARAIQLERHYSKNEILEAYLNLAPYGGNIEGIGTAARIYFDKPAAQLGLPEALALAVIPQNPAKRNPAMQTGHAEMLAARSRLIDIWQAQSGLPPETKAQMRLPLAVRAASELPYRAAHFSRRVVLDAGDLHGAVTTTLDWQMQGQIEKRIERYIERRRASGIRNASAMLVDHRTMEVIASVGSANFFDDAIDGQVDGTDAKRSPGSTLKPFVYGMAIDAGLIHPMTMLKDAPKRFSAYTPENFDRGFMGPVFARDALVYSRNVPAIELLAGVGHQTFNTFLQQGGVRDLRDADHYGLAMVLGGNELSMRELVGLYAMLANGGKLQSLKTLATQAAPEKTAATLLSPEASFLVLDMLRKNPRPDAISLGAAETPPAIAWKTGTSYAYRDAWTVGVYGPYVLAVWVGNFDGSGNPALVGRQAAAPLFFDIADSLPLTAGDRQLNTEPPYHLNLRKVDVCASTGDLPGRHCPRTTPSWFVPGVSPITVSQVHRAVRVDNETGERSCSPDRSGSHEAVYEFWPSDIERLFREAGIARRPPPPWAAECSLDLRAASGTPPNITSPVARLDYQLDPGGRPNAELPLTASADADVEWLYWFANDAFIGKVPRDQPAFWMPGPGQYDLLVVDDLGRSHSRSLSVAMAQ